MRRGGDGPVWRSPGALAVIATTVVLLLVGGLLLWEDRRPTPPPVGPEQELVFSDEFSGSSLDEGSWTDRRGTEPHTYGSPFNPRIEDTLFTPEQVRVTDGSLQLSARPGQVRDELGGAEYGYSSGVVHTGDHFAYTYGYTEARIWVPDDDGFWPAFWMLPTPVDKEWPPEIDIAEFSSVVGSARRPTFNVHWRGPDGKPTQAGSTPYGDPERTYRGGWHTYGLLWQPGRLQVYLDGRPGASFSGENVPDQPMYIVLGMGVVRGTQPPPATMKVDHVRVWSDRPSDPSQ